MHSIAHIVNLFRPPAHSDLKLAQEVTIATMLRAKGEATHPDRVQLLSAQTGQDDNIVPDGFTATTNLTRDVTDLTTFNNSLQLPILKDILDRLYRETTAEYLVFTNVDIGVQPGFYNAIDSFIKAGHDAFIINRRRISDRFTSLGQLNEIYAEKGRRHPGFDCFIFKRELYRRFSLAEVCIGVPFIGITLAQNLFCFADNPKVFTDQHLTFHIGMEVFKGRAPKPYFNYNRQQFWKAMQAIWNDLDTRKWPKGRSFLPWRYLHWGLNPSLPIRLALRLETRRWK